MHFDSKRNYHKCIFCEKLEEHKLKCQNKFCSFCGKSKSSFKTNALHIDHYKKHSEDMSEKHIFENDFSFHLCDFFVQMLLT